MAVAIAKRIFSMGVSINLQAPPKPCPKSSNLRRVGGFFSLAQKIKAEVCASAIYIRIINEPLLLRANLIHIFNCALTGWFQV